MIFLRFMAVAALKAVLTLQAGVASPSSFTVQQDSDGKFWFQNSEGEKFLSVGINHITKAHNHEPPEGSLYYDPIGPVFGGDEEAWKESSRQLLKANGFNTIGAWSAPDLNDGSLYETPIIYIAGYATERVLSGLRDDFHDIARQNVQTMLNNLARPDRVLGVFLDNEMAWYGPTPWDKNDRYTILEHTLALPPDNPERRELIEFLQSRHDSIEAFARAWEIEVSSWSDLTPNLLRQSGTPAAMADRSALREAAADAFYRKSAEVINELLPGVMILGTRFAGDAPDEVIEACGRYSDAVSYNNYRARPEMDEQLLARYWLLTKKPLMITEYSWRGQINRSGNRNTGGAGSVVRTQADRGARYAAFVEDAFSHPVIVGMHWFEFADQSPHGRFDGENSNYGIVNIFHEPYEDLLASMRGTNARVQRIHQQSTREAPETMPEPPAALFHPGQYPNRPASIDLLKVQPVAPPSPFSADDAELTFHSVTPEVHFTADTGAAWGCGFHVHGPAEWAIESGPANATNLDGYSRLILEITMPTGQEAEIVFDEAGVAPSGAMTFDTRAGDDGESFSWGRIIGTGERKTVTLNFEDINPRGIYGNQSGKRVVDLNAALGFGFVFGSSIPSPIEVTFHSVRLEK